MRGPDLCQGYEAFWPCGMEPAEALVRRHELGELAPVAHVDGEPSEVGEVGPGGQVLEEGGDLVAHPVDLAQAREQGGGAEQVAADWPVGSVPGGVLGLASSWPCRRSQVGAEVIGRLAPAREYDGDGVDADHLALDDGAGRALRPEVDPAILAPGGKGRQAGQLRGQQLAYETLETLREVDLNRLQVNALSGEPQQGGSIGPGEYCTSSAAVESGLLVNLRSWPPRRQKLLCKHFARGRQDFGVVQAGGGSEQHGDPVAAPGEEVGEVGPGLLRRSPCDWVSLEFGEPTTKDRQVASPKYAQDIEPVLRSPSRGGRRSLRQLVDLGHEQTGGARNPYPNSPRVVPLQRAQRVKRAVHERGFETRGLARHLGTVQPEAGPSPA